MTLYFTGRDAEFEPNQAIETDENGNESLEGTMHLPLEGAELGWVEEILNNGDRNRFLQGGKSTLGQAGVDSVIDLEQADLDNGRLLAPARLINYSPHQWLEVAQKTRLEIGNWLAE